MRWQLAILWLFFFASAESDIKRRRQIVTPKHLMETRFQPIQQGKVMVTPQNLREVSDLRATIHKSVDEGTYVVASSPSQDFLPRYGGGWPARLTLPHPWIPPAFNFSIFWLRLG